MQDMGWESKVRAALDNDKLSYLGAKARQKQT